MTSIRFLHTSDWQLGMTRHYLEGEAQSRYTGDRVETIRRIGELARARGCAFVVVAGDVFEHANLSRRDVGRALDAMGSVGLPVYLLPGNHDSREQMRASFPQHHYLGSEGFIQYSVPVGGMQLIALDTVVPGASEGSLCTERLQWLEEELARHTSRPVVIAMHHPPFRTLIGHMDDIGLREGADALEAIVARHPQVERVICGHLHRAIQVRFGGTIAATVPSPAHQVRLDLAPDAASAWMLEPPGFALHALPAGGRLVSHTVASGQYAGPYPFHDGGQLID